MWHGEHSLLPENPHLRERGLRTHDKSSVSETELYILGPPSSGIQHSPLPSLPHRDVWAELTDCWAVHSPVSRVISTHNQSHPTHRVIPTHNQSHPPTQSESSPHTVKVQERKDLKSYSAQGSADVRCQLGQRQLLSCPSQKLGEMGL